MNVPGDGNEDLSPKKTSQRIIVCVDHDEPGSVPPKSLEKSVFSLQEKGHLVTVIKPETLHEDFTDVLIARGVDAVKMYARTAPKTIFELLYQTNRRDILIFLKVNEDVI